ncbi:MAG TPA: hypothetical protein GX717_01680 [Clostridiaceae bacterium]|nr:hypothetical protein [Clostridiaceae bacterium]
MGVGVVTDRIGHDIALIARLLGEDEIEIKDVILSPFVDAGGLWRRHFCDKLEGAIAHFAVDQISINKSIKRLLLLILRVDNLLSPQVRSCKFLF